MRTFTMRHTKTTRARGFSLLELMLVIFIIGVLASVAAVNVFGGQDRANARATEATLRTIGVAIKDYRLAKNALPGDLNVLEGEYIDASTSVDDAWDRPLFFATPGPSEAQPFYLSSAGEDGEFGTADDIDYWTMSD